MTATNPGRRRFTIINICMYIISGGYRGGMGSSGQLKLLEYKITMINFIRGLHYKLYRRTSKHMRRGSMRAFTIRVLMVFSDTCWRDGSTGGLVSDTCWQDGSLGDSSQIYVGRMGLWGTRLRYMLAGWVSGGLVSDTCWQDGSLGDSFQIHVGRMGLLGDSFPLPQSKYQNCSIYNS